MSPMFTGTFVFEPSETARFLVGPLELWVWSLEHEWRVAWTHEHDPLLDRSEVVRRAGGWSPPPGARVERFATDMGDRVLQVEPALPDLEVVVRPDPPLVVLAGDTVEVYVGAPLWLKLVLPDGRTLTEVPTVRMPRTWFGASTREGELCFALPSRARLSAAEMPKRAHRVTTALSIANQAQDRLVIERLKVPVPHLGLWRDAQGHLWTEAVSIVRPRGDDDARVSVSGSVPVVAGEVAPVAGARRTGSPSILLRAIDALLS